MLTHTLRIILGRGTGLPTPGLGGGAMPAFCWICRILPIRSARLEPTWRPTSLPSLQPGPGMRREVVRWLNTVEPSRAAHYTCVLTAGHVRASGAEAASELRPIAQGVHEEREEHPCLALTT